MLGNLTPPTKLVGALQDEKLPFGADLITSKSRMLIRQKKSSQKLPGVCASEGDSSGCFIPGTKHFIATAPALKKKQKIVIFLVKMGEKKREKFYQFLEESISAFRGRFDWSITGNLQITRPYSKRASNHVHFLHNTQNREYLIFL